MKNLYDRDKEPASVNELYKNFCFVLLDHKIDCNFWLYGNIHSQEVIEISSWESFIIRDEYHTFKMEIPKYAPSNHT